MSNSSFVSNPNGSRPNFETLSSLQAVTYTLCVILTSITFTVVLLRLWTNYRKLAKLTFDDYFCICAWVLSAAYNIIVLLSASTARHAWDVPRSAIDASWIQRGAILSTIWGPAMWFAKTAILTMYARIFSPLAWMQLCCYFAMGFLFCAFWALVPLSILYNFPHKGEQWDLPMMMGGMSTHLLFAIVGLISVVADVLIVVLPLPTLLRLQMSWKRRLGLSLMFLTAAICIVSGCVVFYLRMLLWRNREADLTWNFAACWLTVAVELNAAVITSCTPAVAAFCNGFFHKSKPIFITTSLIPNSVTLSSPTWSDASHTTKTPLLSSRGLLQRHDRPKRHSDISFLSMEMPDCIRWGLDAPITPEQSHQSIACSWKDVEKYSVVHEPTPYKDHRLSS